MVMVTSGLRVFGSEVDYMKKYRAMTTINIGRDAHAKCAIYEHEGKFYIRCSRAIPYSPFRYEEKLYAEVKYLPCINGEEYWYTV